MGDLEVNSYVVHASGGDIVVDAGAEPEKIFDHLRLRVAAILITHGHSDHVGALDAVRRETNAPVFVHPEDAEIAGVTDYAPLEDEQHLRIAGETIRVLHTPGHSSGSVTFVIGSDQFVGDLILPGSVGRTDISGASWEKMEISIRKIMPLWDSSTRLFTGHGPVLDAMEELRENPYLPLGFL